MNNQYPYKPYHMPRRRNRSKYQRYTSYIIVLTFLAIVISIISLSLKKELNPRQTTTQPDKIYMDNYNAKGEASQENAGIAEANASEMIVTYPYKVTIFKGKISVFKDDESSPFLITDIYTDYLPQEDLRLLKKGIQFEDFNSVRQFLEDFE